MVSMARARKPVDPSSFLAVALDGPSRLSVRVHRWTIVAYARFRKVPGDDPEAALRRLAGMSRDEFEAELERFGEHERGPGRGREKEAVSHSLTEIRTMMRKLHGKGLSPLAVDEPPPGPGSLVGVALDELTGHNARAHQAAYEQFADSLGLPDAEAGLRALKGMDAGQVRAADEGFFAHERGRGQSEKSARCSRGYVRRAGRQLADEGLMKVRVDWRPRRHKDPASRLDAFLSDFGEYRAKSLRTGLNALAGHLGLADAEAAFAALLGMDAGQVVAAVGALRVHLRERVNESAADRVAGTIGTIVRKAHEKGLTDVILPRILVKVGRPRMLPGSILATALEGLKPGSVTAYRSASEFFARYHGSANAEDGLRALGGMDLVRFDETLEGFVSHEVKRGRTEGSARFDQSVLGTMIRKAYAAKLVSLDIDARPRRETEGSCPVVLAGQGKPPTVLGKEQKPLNKEGYDVIKALIEAGPVGLSLEALRIKSGRGGARGVLKRIAESSPEWKRVIRFPVHDGIRHYRIDFQAGKSTNVQGFLDLRA